MAVAAVALSTAALGWMYWTEQLSAHWPGPRVVDALPLDELASHADASLYLFALAMVAAGLVAGVVARTLGYDGYAVALSAGVGIGGWLYVASSISIFVVRQISLDQAFDESRGLPATYLAAVLFALAIVVTARRRTGEQWLTRMLPTSVGVLGVISVLIAALPYSPAHRVALGGLLTGSLSPVSRTIEVVEGIVLLRCSSALGRRSHRALVLAEVLIVISLVVRIVDSFNVVALIVGSVVLVGLVARRGDFAFAGDPSTRSAAGVRFVAVAVVTVAYGVVVLLVNRMAAQLPFHFVRAIKATLHALVIGAPAQSSLISGDFAEWFPWSLRAIAAIGIAWGASTWFAPWRHRIEEASASRRHAKRLVDAWGEDSLAPFTLREDKAHYFFPNPPGIGAASTTLISYRVVRGVAIVSGDPVGPADQVPDALLAFRAMCAERGWRFALLGASERYLGTYRALGLHPIYHGDEAVLDPSTFGLAGGELKSVRQAVNRLARKGYRAEVRTAGELSTEERTELEALERRWLGGGQRKGFVMELDELFRLDGDDLVFVVGRDVDGAALGFLEIAVCRSNASLSLSSMPRSDEAPNGLNAFLIVTLVGWANDHGFDEISLNFSPGARWLASGSPRTVANRIVIGLLRALQRFAGFQLDSLFRFNQHFGPRWQPRYVIVDRFRDLPRVTIAAMAAERYLPFAEILRGRERADRGAVEDSTLVAR